MKSIPSDSPFRARSAVLDYGTAIVAVAAATGLSFTVYPRFSPINVSMVYLVATLVVAMRGRRGPAALASLLSVLCFDFFFVPPRFSFTVADAEYLFTFCVMLFTAMVISHLTIRLRTEAESARRSEAQAMKMHEFTRKLAALRGSEAVLETAAEEIGRLFNGHVTVYQRQAGRMTTGGQPSSERDTGVANWVFEKGQPAGLGADSLPSEEALFLPLPGTDGPVGVLSLKPRSATAMSPDERNVLESFCRQLALAFEVARLEDEAKRAAVDAETERMRSALLSSVSHDFRSPLAAIVGSASTLLQREDISSHPPTRELIENIENEAGRLSEVVRNLLEATKIESGGLRVHKEHFPVEEIVGTALGRLEKNLRNRNVTVVIAPGLDSVAMDGVLIEQVLNNLLENALRHAGAGVKMGVNVARRGSDVLFEVWDGGAGIAESDLERVFDKFYRSPSSPGSGLGLSICRAIVVAHGGAIWVRNRPEGGASFLFTLPIEESLRG